MARSWKHVLARISAEKSNWQPVDFTNLKLSGVQERISGIKFIRHVRGSSEGDFEKDIETLSLCQPLIAVKPNKKVHTPAKPPPKNIKLKVRMEIPLDILNLTEQKDDRQDTILFEDHEETETEEGFEDCDYISHFPATTNTNSQNCTWGSSIVFDRPPSGEQSKRKKLLG